MRKTGNAEAVLCAHQLWTLWLFEQGRGQEALDAALEAAPEPTGEGLSLLEEVAQVMLEQPEEQLQRLREHLLICAEQDPGFGVWTLLQRAAMDPFQRRADLPEEDPERLSPEAAAQQMVEQLERIRAVQERVLPEDAAETLLTRTFAAEGLIAAGRPEQARELLEGFEEAAAPSLGADHPMLADVRQIRQEAEAASS